jgi:crossover junction endodeoxyribonuclease RusA
MGDIILSGRLPVAPSINASRRPGGKNSRTVHTKVARVFIKDARVMLTAASIDWEAVKYVRAKYDKEQHVPLELNITYFFNSMWRRDEDGGIKITQDVVFDYLDLNDNLVIDLHVKKRMDKADPRTEVSLCIAEE